MNGERLRQVALAVLALCCSAYSALAQGYPPDEAAGRMTIAAGLESRLVASEPMIRQPVAMEFDDAGRLWVIQYLQYPNPSGLKRAKVDRYSRTTYDKTPQPPPGGPTGDDRITILEDTDGDGRADRAKDFLSGLNLATGLAFGHGGAFVLQVPYLLFYPDRNHDDVPDSDPDVLLSGFGMEDAHSVANSLTWGPDGWLYGCQGSTVTSNIRGIEFQQGVWRYHPLSHRFELFCEGGGNSWGLDFDEHGNLFYSTNYGGYSMLHGVQGAYYWKQFGKHGALHNPFAYGYFDHVPHKNLHGGHVTVGGIVYQGDSFPSHFRGKYIAADLLGHAVYWHELLPRGSTFSATQISDLLLANDTWFAPSDVTMGPDGSVYVCDWHDQRTAHPDPDADWDRSNGRIYRVQATGLSPKPVKQVASLASQELVGRLNDKNDWYVRKARRVLADRRDPEVILPLRTLVTESKDPHQALEALWALYVSGGFSEEFSASLLSHSNDDVRLWTVRLLGDEDSVSPSIAARLAELAARDPSVAVRGQLACTAKRLPADQSLPIVRQLLEHAEDHDDPYVPLLIWWAVEKHAVAEREQVLAIFTAPQTWQLPLVQGAIVERLMRRYAAEATREGYLACGRLLAAAPMVDRDKMLAALDAGLKDRATPRGGSAGTLFANLALANNANNSQPALSVAEIPAQLSQQIDRAWRDDTTDIMLIRLAARLNRPAAMARAIALAGDSHTPLAKRIETVQLLGEVGRSAGVDALLALFASEQPQPLQLAIVDALGRFEDERVVVALLERFSTFGPALRGKACDVLLSRGPWALRLLEAIDRGQFAAKDFSVDQLRPIALHHDRRLDELVKKHWGAIQGGTPEERLAEMRRISNDLRAGHGELAAGKALFAKHCGTCHRLFGEGNQVGPELTHANRKNTDELLATIVSPSAVIRKEFLSFLVQTKDGRVLTGLLVEQSPSSVTLLNAKNERINVARDQIETISESPTSLMPENLLSPLKPQELRDLFGYLQHDPSASAALTHRPCSLWGIPAMKSTPIDTSGRVSQIDPSRRHFLVAGLAAGAGVVCGRTSLAAEPAKADGAKPVKAQITITLDLEMSRNFPVWEEMRWDYEKGNLNEETKRYTVEACRRVKAHGGVLHCFAVGRVFEQENVEWLKQIVQVGHPLGNHTYDHVNVKATRPEDLQFRFRRSPWLIEGKSPTEVVRENIRLANVAIKTRLGVNASGFRTPGGFADGLIDRPDLQQMLLDLGFTWVSSLYPPHTAAEPMQRPSPAMFESIIAAQNAAQPFAYPTGLVEVPMSPISDIGAFRTGRWKLDWFLEAIERGVQWAIDHGAAYDFLGHPSCLYVTDPDFRTVELICDLVRKAGDRAELVDLNSLAKRGVNRPQSS